MVGRETGEMICPRTVAEPEMEPRSSAPSTGAHGLLMGEHTVQSHLAGVKGNLACNRVAYLHWRNEQCCLQLSLHQDF